MIEFAPMGRESHDETEIRVRRIPHPLVMVLSADCDLYWDHQLRSGRGGTPQKELSHTLLCESYDEARLEEIWINQDRMSGTDRRRLFERIRTHQAPRYHYLPRAMVGRHQTTEELFVDFKRSFTIATGDMYYQIRRRLARRIGFLIPPYVHHLAQRCYYYLGRIGVDE